jgi:hypothetical protein
MENQFYDRIQKFSWLFDYDIDQKISINIKNIISIELRLELYKELGNYFRIMFNEIE